MHLFKIINNQKILLIFFAFLLNIIPFPSWSKSCLNILSSSSNDHHLSDLMQSHFNPLTDQDLKTFIEEYKGFNGMLRFAEKIQKKLSKELNLISLKLYVFKALQGRGLHPQKLNWMVFPGTLRAFNQLYDALINRDNQLKTKTIDSKEVHIIQLPNGTELPIYGISNMMEVVRKYRDFDQDPRKAYTMVSFVTNGMRRGNPSEIFGWRKFEGSLIAWNRLVHALTDPQTHQLRKSTVDGEKVHIILLSDETKLPMYGIFNMIEVVRKYRDFDQDPRKAYTMVSVVTNGMGWGNPSEIFGWRKFEGTLTEWNRLVHALIDPQTHQPRKSTDGEEVHIIPFLSRGKSYLNILPSSSNDHHLLDLIQSYFNPLTDQGLKMFIEEHKEFDGMLRFAEKIQIQKNLSKELNLQSLRLYVFKTLLGRGLHPQKLNWMVFPGTLRAFNQLYDALINRDNQLKTKTIDSKEVPIIQLPDGKKLPMYGISNMMEVVRKYGDFDQDPRKAYTMVSVVTNGMGWGNPNKIFEWQKFEGILTEWNRLVHALIDPQTHQLRKSTVDGEKVHIILLPNGTKLPMHGIFNMMEVVRKYRDFDQDPRKAYAMVSVVTNGMGWGNPSEIFEWRKFDGSLVAWNRLVHALIDPQTHQLRKSTVDGEKVHIILLPNRKTLPIDGNFNMMEVVREYRGFQGNPYKAYKMVSVVTNGMGWDNPSEIFGWVLYNDNDVITEGN